MDYSDINLFFAAFITQPSFQRVSIFTWGIYKFPKWQDQKHGHPSTNPDWSMLPRSVAPFPRLHYCCHHQHVFTINNPMLFSDIVTNVHIAACTATASVTLPTLLLLENQQQKAHIVPLFCFGAFLRIKINMAWLVVWLTHLRPTSFSRQEVGMTVKNRKILLHHYLYFLWT